MEQNQKSNKTYSCPMHPEIVFDKPGRCPKCGMRLMPKDEIPERIVSIQTEDRGLGDTTWRSYIPLMVIGGLLLLVAFSFGLKDFQAGVFSVRNILTYFMIGFFLTFAGFKLIDLKGFAEGYSTYDLLAQRWFAYGYIYPFVELFFGLAMIFTQSSWLLSAEILVMGFSGIGVANKLIKREQFQCVCLGTFLKVPLTKVTLVEDFGMATLALIMLLMHGAYVAEINPLIFKLHSPEELPGLISLGHWITGYIFGVVAIVALIQAFGILRSKSYLWPAIVVIAGIIFIPYSFLHHGLAQFGLVLKIAWLDLQQRQHIIMFFLLFAAGLSEFLYAISKLKNEIWRFVCPSVLAIIGLMFIFHPQHGVGEALAFSQLLHRTLGLVLVLAGILRGAEIVSIPKRKWLSFAWIIFLFIAATLLITYIEPKEAYQLSSEIQG